MPGDRLILRSGNDLRLRVRLACIGIVLMGAVSCGDLVSVDTLDVIQPTDLENRAGARALRAGAIGDFTNVYAGTFSHTVVLLSGRITDEFSAAIAGDVYDQRTMPEITTVNNMFPLARARVGLKQALVAMQRFDSESGDDIAELFSLRGYTELFFAENFCSGMPLSSIVDGQVVYGEQLTTVQVLEEALTGFDSALGHAGNQTSSQHLAQVGRARALVQLGRLNEAATAAAGVPTGFVYQTSHIAGTQFNSLWRWLHDQRAYTVGNRAGINGLDFATAQDPRVPVRQVGIGPDGVTEVFAPENHAEANSPVTLASGIEARLIEAEAMLQGGDGQGALAILNSLRETMPGLDPLPLETTQDGRIDQLFRERAFWLFGTGHRHGDLRRLVRQYGRSVESVFPTGPYRQGLSYGVEVTIGFDPREENNPHFTGACLSRNP